MLIAASPTEKRSMREAARAVLVKITPMVKERDASGALPSAMRVSGAQPAAAAASEPRGVPAHPPKRVRLLAP